MKRARSWPTLLGMFALLTLAGCAPRRPAVTVDAAEIALSARESALFEQQRFELRGRIGVSNGKDAGSGQFVWVQDGPRFDFTLTVTLTGDRVRLEGQPGRVTLTDAAGRQQTGFDAEQLLAARTGWHVPVSQLGYWIRAMRAPEGPATPEFAADGHLQRLTQLGWQIDYQRWQREGDPPLPSKLLATRAPHKVRVLIHDWR